MKLAIIGAGNMGAAIYHRLQAHFHKDHLWLCDPNPEKRKGTPHASSDIHEIQDKVDAVLLAIKPQSFKEWTQQLPNHLIISIMTGISLKSLEQQTGASRVVRSMPNLALKIGESVTGWMAGPSVTSEDKTFVQSLFTHFGFSFEVDKEEKLNDITALSGSGPAYFFYFCEQLIHKAEEFGFSKEEAKHIVLGTIKGASLLLQEEDGEAETLRKAITSTKGTTEAALKAFDSKHFSEMIYQAVDAAKKRAEELSQ